MNDKIILTPTNIKISSSELYFFVCLVLHCKESNVSVVVFLLKVWWHEANLYKFSLSLFTVHSYKFIHTHSLITFAEFRSSFFICHFYLPFLIFSLESMDFKLCYCYSLGRNKGFNYTVAW